MRFEKVGVIFCTTDVDTNTHLSATWLDPHGNLVQDGTLYEQLNDHIGVRLRISIVTFIHVGTWTCHVVAQEHYSRSSDGLIIVGSRNVKVEVTLFSKWKVSNIFSLSLYDYYIVQDTLSTTIPTNTRIIRRERAPIEIGCSIFAPNATQKWTLWTLSNDTHSFKMQDLINATELSFEGSNRSPLDLVTEEYPDYRDQLRINAFELRFEEFSLECRSRFSSNIIYASWKLNYYRKWSPTL